FSFLFHCATAAMTSRKQTAFATKIQLAPNRLRTTAAMAGPIMPQRLICTPPSVTAEGNSSEETTSGTTALQAGALKANPTPIRKMESKIRYGFSKPNAPSTASEPAQIANHRFIVHNNFFRSIRSASEPAGKVKKNRGSEATVAINEMRNLD